MSRIVIQTNPVYTTLDGEHFFDKEQARHHAQGLLFGAAIDAGVEHNPQFARLDRDLMIQFMRTFGTRIGEMARDPLHIAPIQSATTEPAATAETKTQPRTITPIDRRPPMPSTRGDILGQAMQNVDAAAQHALETADLKVS